MSSSEGNSTTRPMRRRKSKRFDRSGGSPRVGGSAVLEGEINPVNERPEAESPAETHETTNPGDSTTTDASGTANGDGRAVGGSGATGPEPVAVHPGINGQGATTPGPTGADPTVRNRTLDELTLCGRCGHEVSTINIEVDGNVLIMESCDNCDTRRWQLAGERIELQQALDHVGEHAGRRR